MVFRHRYLAAIFSKMNDLHLSLPRKMANMLQMVKIELLVRIRIFGECISVA